MTAPTRQQRPVEEVQPESRPVPYEDSPSYFPTSPFGIMRRLSDEMDRMFGGFIPFGTSFGPSRRFAGGLQRAEWVPPVEVFDRDNRLVVRAELPGMNK